MRCELGPERFSVEWPSVELGKVSIRGQENLSTVMEYLDCGSL